MPLLRNLFRKKKPHLSKGEAVQLFADTFGLNDEQVKALTAVMSDKEAPVEVQGDGHAEFIAPMTEDEYAKWLHEEEHGWGKVYKKLLARGTNENGDA